MELFILSVLTIALLAGALLALISLFYPERREEEELPKLIIPVQVVEKPTPPPVQLSKFREERAVLPKITWPCEKCKGVQVTWILRGDFWLGLCRRCGTPFAKVERENWQQGA